MRWGKSVREQAARLFEQGLGYKAVSSRLGLNREIAREWSYAYRALGTEGLLSVGKRTTYPPEVKLAAARDRVDGDVPVVEVMARYGVHNRRQIKEWSGRYAEDGAAAFGLVVEEDGEAASDPDGGDRAVAVGRADEGDAVELGRSGEDGAETAHGLPSASRGRECPDAKSSDGAHERAGRPFEKGA